MFLLASLLGGLATDQAWLITARAVQGAGAAMAAPTALSLIAVTFPEGRPRNRAVAVYSAMAIVGIPVGLLAGGLLVTYASWRWVFFVNVPIGLVVVVLAIHQLTTPGVRPGTHVPQQAQQATAMLAIAACEPNAAVSRRLGVRRCLPSAHSRGAGGWGAVLADHPAVYGVLAEAEALGLELIEVRRLPSDEPREPSS